MGVIANTNRKRIAAVACLLAVAITFAGAARAQLRVGIPSLHAADSLLVVGVEHFESGNYSLARSAFDGVLRDFRDNTATTTAVMLAAKSAYRQRLFEDVLTYLNGFASSYPSSGYVSEARFLSDLSVRAIKYSGTDSRTIGVILSLNEEERIQTQEMFNGIRLAVDYYNQNSSDRSVRMIYRDSDGGPPAVRKAVRELARQDVDLIIGTLFSEDAIAAANEAERQRVVFIAPLATDERVSSAKEYAFQANPSMSVRGAAMARFAVNGLRMDSLGVILALDDRKISERLADGFIQEASRLGADIGFILILQDESPLFQLAVQLPPDTLKGIDAVYIPLASRDPVSLAGAIFSNLDRISKDVRVLGNSAWHNLPQLSHASAYTTTYGNDYLVHIESADYQVFREKFKILSGTEPGRLGVTGYDVTTYMLNALSSGSMGSLADVIRRQRPFEGLGMRIHFNGMNVNQSLYYHRYRDNILSLIR